MTTGEGGLTFRRVSERVRYEIKGRVAELRSTAQGRTVRGAIHTSPDIALAAFRAGYVTLTLEDGRQIRVTTTAYSDGDSTVYFEVVL